MPNKQELNINGSPHTIQADPERSLLSVLRDDLDMTGTKYGCGEGQCAACTVLIDGQPTPSCITPAGSVAGRQIVTIEGLEKGGKLHPVQEAFLAEDALQCAYCTSGMILGAVALLKENSNPTDAEIAQAMQNHVCRCGTYPRILRAVHSAARMSRRTNR